MPQYLPESTQVTEIVLIRVDDKAVDQPEAAIGEDMDWGRYSTQKLPVHYVGGDHVTMMTQPHVKKLAQILTDVIILGEKAAFG